MEVVRSRHAAHSLDLRLSVLSRNSKRPASNVCSYWLAGCCNRNTCTVIHGGVTSATVRSTKRSHAADEERPKKRRNSATNESKEKDEDKSRVHAYWISGNCVYDDQCPNIHSWFVGDDSSLFKKLSGHGEAVTGINLPSGCNSLFSGSKDGSIKVWGYHSGRCEKTMNVGGYCKVSQTSGG